MTFLGRALILSGFILIGHGISPIILELTGNGQQTAATVIGGAWLLSATADEVLTWQKTRTRG